MTLHTYSVSRSEGLIGSPHWTLGELSFGLSSVPYNEGIDVYVSPGKVFPVALGRSSMLKTKLE